MALWSPPTRGARVVVHFHGNGEQLADLGGVIAALRNRGLGVLAVEYPGYGLAGGSPSERALVSAGEEALAYAKEKLRVAPDRIVLQGQSLGSGVAAQLCSRGHGSRLVLLSPYTSIPDLASRLFRPARWLVRDRFDTRAVARALRLPVLIVHGVLDEVIPFSMGDELARTFPDARFVRVLGGHHNDLWLDHAQELTEAISSFVGPSAAP